jgi:hypothetical protein
MKEKWRETVLRFPPFSVFSLFTPLMDLLYHGLHRGVGLFMDFSFIPMLFISAIGFGINSIRNARPPRILVIVGYLLLIAAAIHLAQPFCREWYYQQSIYDERVEILKNSCTNPRPGLEPVSGACVQLGLDIMQWPITLAYNECVKHLKQWIKDQFTVTALVWLGTITAFLFSLIVLLVVGCRVDRHNVFKHHQKREEKLRQMTQMSGAPSA